jgi:hypothetical protein
MKTPAFLAKMSGGNGGGGKLGARLGVGICLLGFAFIFFGWNGAASSDRVPSQFPYLISGGLTGLALVVLGGALILVETSRAERERLRSEIAELRAAIDNLAGSRGSNGSAPGSTRSKAPPVVGRGSYVAGDHTFHTPTCRLLEGRGTLERVSAQEAADRGLAPCRVCEPAGAPSSRR